MFLIPSYHRGQIAISKLMVVITLIIISSNMVIPARATICFADAQAAFSQWQTNQASLTAQPASILTDALVVSSQTPTPMNQDSLKQLPEFYQRRHAERQSRHSNTVPPAQAHDNTLSQRSRNDTVNINTATASELVTLTGIGIKKAQAIVQYRQQYGRFETPDDLANVKGIGKKTISKNRTRLVVN